MHAFNPPFKTDKKAGGIASEELQKRQAALKQFRLGDPVVINGGVSAMFERADMKVGNAIVTVGRKEMPVNPLNIQRSNKKK